MCNNSTTIEINVFNKTYTLQCELDQREQLQHAASYLDEQMSKLKNLHQSISSDEIAIIAALNVTSELLELKEKEKHLNEISTTIDNIQSNINTSLS
jgi:cell division protein ZapA